MNGILARLKRVIGRVATWYASPTGLISAAALIASLILSATGLEGAAIWVLIAWLGVLLPYKLGRERADRAQQFAALSKRMGSVNRGVKKVRAETASVRTELSVIPTLEELTDWQEAVERRAASAESKVMAFDQLRASVRLQREATRTLHDEHAFLRDGLKTEIETLQSGFAELKASLMSDAAALRAESNSLTRNSEAGIASIREETSRQITQRTQQIERKSTADLAALVALYTLLGARSSLPSFASWALSPAAALAVAEVVVETEARLVVEAGSGSSTVVVALALAKQGSGRVVALEHDAAFAEKTRRDLRRHGVEDYAEVVLAPLVEYVLHGDSYRWYDLAAIDIDGPIDVLLVDGPPGATGPLARYPAVPLMAEHLSHDAVVLLDDVQRDEEQEIARRWGEQFELGFEMGLADGDLARGRFQRPLRSTPERATEEHA